MSRESLIFDTILSELDNVITPAYSLFLKDSTFVRPESDREIDLEFEGLYNKVAGIYNQVFAAVRQLQKPLQFADNDKQQLIAYYENCFQRYFEHEVVPMLHKVVAIKIRQETGAMVSGYEITPELIRNEYQKINRFAHLKTRKHYWFYFYLANTVLNLLANIDTIKASESAKIKLQEPGPGVRK
jgi:hypothetical protein